MVTFSFFTRRVPSLPGHSTRGVLSRSSHLYPSPFLVVHNEDSVSGKERRLMSKEKVGVQSDLSSHPGSDIGHETPSQLEPLGSSRSPKS